MKEKMKRILLTIFIKLIYLWGTIWYDKKYLVGKMFDRRHFSSGWKWILKYWFPQKILGYARDIPFPIPRGVIIVNPQNIVFHPDDLANFFSNGCFYQATKAEIIIGKGTMIAQNCGIITTNHNQKDLTKHLDGKRVEIGENCWIGMNSVILPGVKLANHIIVGAGSVVTKSFQEENIIIAGNPAKKIKNIEM